jgi:2-oxoglutarate dehydrogenase E2 component (dihydrolipoamide succinyltransferase)
MAKFELLTPKMGESITEVTILAWKKKVGDRVSKDETILEIATDKVDSEIPSEVDGVITEILYQVDAVVAVGKCLAIIDTEMAAIATPAAAPVVEAKAPQAVAASPQIEVPYLPNAASASVATNGALPKSADADRFYSPLVRTIAKQENIAFSELESIAGTGQNGRVTKVDITAYVQQKSNNPLPISPNGATHTAPVQPVIVNSPQPTPKTTSVSGGNEIIEMDRMRRLIADHMVMSKHTSPHVTSFVEADVTNLVNWRSKVKDEYKKKHNENITFTPIFIEAVAKAIRDFPMINVSVDGTKIIMKKDINIGMAAALPSGNLIVPVIKNADMLNLAGLTKTVNDLASRARNNQLKPDDVQGGTFTLTNVGTFGNVMGTPIINQPQVAILAVGAIRKKPAVVETEFGDLIAIRQMMFLSLSYDHRVVDGFLGGSFLRKVADYLEGFDAKRQI